MTTPDLSQVPWPVRTERLLLRRARPEDHAATYVFRRLPAVHEWITTAPGAAEQWAERFADPDRLGPTLIVERDGEVIGDLMLRLERLWAQSEVPETARGWQAEIGWTLHPDHTGQGLATEAVRALVDVCFGPLHLHRVVAQCFVANERSWRLMERLGMRREEHGVRNGLHRTRGWMDGFTYAVLADEWPSAPSG